MYKLKKVLWISAAHSLDISYDSPCQNIHGHNWKITVYCKRERLDANGMVVDFSEIKRIVNQLDHTILNPVIKQNPTAENIAKWIHSEVPYCYKVKVEETKGNSVVYEGD